MFKQIENLAGREYYLIFSLIVFVVFFILVTAYLIKLNKGYINEMSELPFADQNMNQYEEI